ncbi:MAG: ATP synthase F0 subunit B [Blastocatellia bacterium]|nr:ATP synthase F0 subunit B [Blastocatellia bacterium]
MLLLAFAESIQLFPDGTLFIHIGLILVMIWVLNRTFFKPINAVIDRRSKQKVGRGGEADDILREVIEKEKQYEQTMRKARGETYEMIERERAAAVDARQAAITGARTEAAELLTREQKELRDQIAEARVSIALEAEKMSDKISGTILKV